MKFRWSQLKWIWNLRFIWLPVQMDLVQSIRKRLVTISLFRSDFRLVENALLKNQYSVVLWRWHFQECARASNYILLVSMCGEMPLEAVQFRKINVICAVRMLKGMLIQKRIRRYFTWFRVGTLIPWVIYTHVLISFVNLEKLLSELIASEARKLVFFSSSHNSKSLYQRTTHIYRAINCHFKCLKIEWWIHLFSKFHEYLLSIIKRYSYNLQIYALFLFSFGFVFLLLTVFLCFLLILIDCSKIVRTSSFLEWIYLFLMLNTSAIASR